MRHKGAAARFSDFDCTIGVCSWMVEEGSTAKPSNIRNVVGLEKLSFVVSPKFVT